MKKSLLSLIVIFVSFFATAQGYTYVSGYTRSNGTYVEGYYRTLPNSTLNDNWSTIGNINPFTGAYGTRPGDSYYSNYSSYSTPSYSASSYTSSSLSSFNYSSPSYAYPSYSSYPSLSLPSTYSYYNSPITFFSSNSIFTTSGIYRY